MVIFYDLLTQQLGLLRRSRSFKVTDFGTNRSVGIAGGVAGVEPPNSFPNPPPQLR